MRKLAIIGLALVSFPLNAAAWWLCVIAEALSKAMVDMADTLNQLGIMASNKARTMLDERKGELTDE
jgi:hypothetical protein